MTSNDSFIAMVVGTNYKKKMRSRIKCEVIETVDPVSDQNSSKNTPFEKAHTI